jgi:hypothetical protein
VGTGGCLPGGKARPGRDADLSPPSSAEVKKEQELYLLSPKCASMERNGTTLPFIFYCLPNTIKIIEAKGMKWSEHASYLQRQMYGPDHKKFRWENLNKNKQLRSSMHTGQENNNEMNLEHTGHESAYTLDINQAV